MIITGSALFIEPETSDIVLEKIGRFPGVTFQVMSESGKQLVVNLEAEDHEALESLCRDLRSAIPEIVEIAHIYVNFEDEVEKMAAAETAVEEQVGGDDSTTFERSEA
jgi:nitrate reductase NapAB chaperone NapD